METRGLCIQCLLQGYLDGQEPHVAFVRSIEEHIRRYHADEEETIRARMLLQERLFREKRMSVEEFFHIVMRVAGDMALEMALIDEGATTIH